MKLNKLSLDLLQYLRANLVFTFKFQPPEVRNMVTVSSPVDTDFEVFCINWSWTLTLLCMYYFEQVSLLTAFSNSF